MIEYTYVRNYIVCILLIYRLGVNGLFLYFHLQGNNNDITVYIVSLCAAFCLSQDNQLGVCSESNYSKNILLLKAWSDLIIYLSFRSVYVYIYSILQYHYICILKS